MAYRGKQGTGVIAGGKHGVQQREFFKMAEIAASLYTDESNR